MLNVVDSCIPCDLATGTTADIEEERRLLHVAMTRAKDSLHLVSFMAKARKATDVYASRTRFVPAALLPLFERTTWPTAVTAASDRPNSRQVRLDVGARLRSMWR